MVLTIKKKFGFYKCFEQDIWGLSFSDFYRSNKVNEFFFKLHLSREEFRLNKVRRYVYRIDVINPRRSRKNFKARFLSLRLVKLFFLTLTYRQFRRMAYLAAEKDGLFQANFCSLLEGRLVSVIYRTNFLYSMFEIISFVKDSNVFVNNILINYVNFVVRVGDFITFNEKHRSRFKANFFKRFKTQTILFNTPRYMFVCYKLFFAFMERAPMDNDLVYPIKLDIYRATAYY
jgi:ribosomal protein S4